MKKKIYAVLIAFIILMVGLEIMFAHPHYHQPWNEIPGADVLLGFAGAWLLIFMAKIVMARILQRPNDYYDGGAKKGGRHK